MFLRNKTMFGMSVASVAVMAAMVLAPAPASADDARLTVTPAVLQTGDSTSPQASIQQVRWGRGGWGRGWGGYRGYGRGYGWGGYRGWGYRGYYRPYVGVYPYGYGYGYGYPGYGYGYGPGYGYW
jgi:hypothetical protein